MSRPEAFLRDPGKKKPRQIGGAKVSARVQAAGTGGNSKRLWRLSVAHLGPDLLTEHIYWHGLAVALEAPVGPPIATWRAFERRTDLVD